MSPVSFMPFYGDDFDGSTMDFTAAECWAHWAWCWHGFTNGGRLPNDPRLLKRWGRVDRRHWDRISTVVLARWKLSACGNFWTHPRVTREVERAKLQREKARNRGKRGRHAQGELPLDLSPLSTGPNGGLTMGDSLRGNNPMNSTPDSSTTHHPLPTGDSPLTPLDDWRGDRSGLVQRAGIHLMGGINGAASYGHRPVEPPAISGTGSLQEGELVIEQIGVVRKRAANRARS